jgi:hypothetical protein
VRIAGKDAIFMWFYSLAVVSCLIRLVAADAHFLFLEEFVTMSEEIGFAGTLHEWSCGNCIEPQE